ncbi:MAG TPA: type II secretion system protein [Steroidobacteraceae bacterium]
MRCPSPRRQRGVTLVEMVIVISITAIIAGAVAVFITRPIESYADAARRAELTDIADTALRRMARDLRTALPNSVRTTTVGNVRYLEFLQTTGGGRYRAQPDSGGGGNTLDFTVVDGSFDVIGALPTLAAGDSIVVYNLNNSGAVANAYSGDNRRAYASTAGSTINITPTAAPLPFSSPGNRFQVVQQPVSYACDPDPGTRTLRRYWGYPIVAAQPTPPGAGNNALLASDVFECTFTYTAAGAGGRYGVVSLEMRVQRDTELIRLFHQVHVTNVP